MTGGWTTKETSDAEWDALVGRFDGASMFQSAAWAAHRRGSGWEAERWSLHQSGIRAVVQLLLRRRAGLVVAWAPGGPLVDISGAAGGSDATVVPLLDDLFTRLRDRHGAIYVRADAPAPPGSVVAAALAGRCRRPLVRLNTGTTVVLDLSSDADGRLASMSKHHRHEVRRGMACGIDWAIGRGRDEVDALVALHAQMTSRKGIATAPQAERSAILSLCRSFGERAHVLVGSKAGLPVTACLSVAFTHTAFFHTAATGGAGLRCGASYAAVHMLAILLAERGIRRLDLGGLDTGRRMSGVARFKQGFGGAVVTRTGEWSWASRPGLDLFVDLALLLRRGAMGA